MCLGLPMRVLEFDATSALVEGLGERRRVSLLLVGPVRRGTPLLVHAERAVRILDEADVPLLERAMRGLQAAMKGQPMAGYFDDLDREPQLPEHLRPKERP